ncbi:MAG: Calx-beta domain-containing protein, partial [Microcystaceae cyanobacterium]
MTIVDGLTIGGRRFPNLYQHIVGFDRFDLGGFLGTVHFTGGSGDDLLKFGTNNSLPNLSDYVATGDGNDTVITLTFFPGNTTNIIQVKVNGDDTAELDETFWVDLSNIRGGAVLGESQVLGRIINDESGILFTGTSGNDNFTGG